MEGGGICAPEWAGLVIIEKLRRTPPRVVIDAGDRSLIVSQHMPRVLPVVRAVAMFLILLACMLGGILAAAGVCGLVFGWSILDTTLGPSPDRTHPAFWLFMIVMVPGMLVGAAGALFGVILPIAARWPVAGFPGAPLDRRFLRAYLSWVGKLVAEEPKGGADPAAG